MQYPLKDIFNDDMKLVGFIEFKEKLHENYRWFEYYKLISAVPSKRKDKPKACHVEDMQQGTDDIFFFLILKKSFCYKIIREKNAARNLRIAQEDNREVE